jgi:hypothetical protein
VIFSDIGSGRGPETVEGEPVEAVSQTCEKIKITSGNFMV